MYKQEVLDYVDAIDTTIMESEINVLISIGQSYQKALSIIESIDDDKNDIVKESYSIFQEGLTDSIKGIFSNLFNFFKKIFQNVKNMMLKIFSDKRLIYTANILRISEQVEMIGKSKFVKESYSDNGDIYQEGLINKTPQEKLMATAKKAREENIKEQKKAHKEEETIAKQKAKTILKDTDISKYLPKGFNKNTLYRELSENEIINIAEFIAKVAPTSEFDQCVSSIRRIMNESKPSMGIIKKIRLYMTIGQIFAEERFVRAFQELSTITPLRKVNANVSMQFANANNDINNKAEEKIKYLKETDSDKLEKDLDLIQKFCDTLGKAFNDTSGVSSFEYDKLKNAMYGGRPVKSLLSLLANQFVGMVHNIPAIVKNIDTINTYLYTAHHNFAAIYDEDVNIRKELKIKTNKTMQMAMITLDNIKEETYGWTDDQSYNHQTYAHGNPLTFIMGGPFTASVKIIQFVITKDNSLLY